MIIWLDSIVIAQLTCNLAEQCPKNRGEKQWNSAEMDW